MSASVRLAWCVAHAAAFALAFPQLIAGSVWDAGLVFAWCAPMTLLLVGERLESPRAFAYGALAGWLAHAVLLHWIFVATVRYGNAHPALGVGSVLLLACYGAIFTGLFCAGAALVPDRRASTPLFLACLWVVLDWLRSVLFTGFPWGTLGYALHADVWARSWVAYTGVYGLSFLAALGGVALRDLFRGRTARGIAWSAVVLALHGIGGLLSVAAPDSTGETVRVGIVQGNIEQGVKWEPAWAERTLRVYEVETRRAVERGARLVVWPETAVPGSPDLDPGLVARLEGLARETGAILVVGAVGIDGYDPAAPSYEGLRYFDSAYLFDPEAGLRERYDKTHLVPFGEYVPFRKLIGRFVHAVASGATSGDVTPGPEPRALRIAQEGREPLTVGVPICYELLFPRLVGRFARDGAELLLAITNDAWYGKTGAPFQFLAITAMRSAESGLWTARAANTGVSALIDSRGDVQVATGIFERDVLVGDVPLRLSALPTTFYARFGNVFAAACGLLLLAPVLQAALSRRGGWRGR